MKKYTSYLGLSLMFLHAIACERPDPPLTRSERNWIDSIYSEQIIYIKRRNDSMCILRNDSIYKSNFDSILQKRRTERILIIRKQRSIKDD